MVLPISRRWFKVQTRQVERSVASRRFVGLPDSWDQPSYLAVRSLVGALEQRGWAIRRRHDVLGRMLVLTKLDRTYLSSSATLVPLMGPLWRHLATFGVQGPIVLYCWDIWEPALPDFVDRIGRYRVQGVMTTAYDAAEALKTVLPELPVAHVPEAIDSAEFDGSRPLVERGLHVLEMGRRFDRWHDDVVAHLASKQIRHAYQNSLGDLAFRDRLSLVRALEDSVISVCVPGSITHPRRCGRFETVTQRYLESMAAGAVVLGAAPKELVRWCGYDPVVPIDWHDPVSQVLQILNTRDTFQSLVDRNRDFASLEGSWATRASLIERHYDEMVGR